MKCFLKILMYEDMYELRKHWICLCTEYIFDFLISQADLESLVPRDSDFFKSLYYSLKFACFVTIIFICLCWNIAFVLYFGLHASLLTLMIQFGFSSFDPGIPKQHLFPGFLALWLLGFLGSLAHWVLVYTDLMPMSSGKVIFSWLCVLREDWIGVRDNRNDFDIFVECLLLSWVV